MNEYVDAVAYGTATVDYRVRYSTRTTLEIAVHPDQAVVVRAPWGTEPVAVRRVVRKRARWIQRQVAHFEQFQPRTPARKYLSGESHLYLGRSYRLKLAAGGTVGVRLSGGYLEVSGVSTGDADSVQKILDAWYAERAQYWLTESFVRQWAILGAELGAEPRLQLRSMRTRWGSLSPSGVLTLNRALVRAPRVCIDYVIVHELCHLKHHDHGPAFYRLLARRMPDWESRKTRLERLLA